MKKIFALLAVSMLAFTACSDDDDEVTPGMPDQPGQTEEAYIDATQKKTWTYFSLKDNKVVGTGEESEAGDAEWAKRSDWDIAVNRYMIRTNSGAATSVNAKGGVSICAETVAFESLNAVPQGTEFKADTAVTSEGMSGVTTVIKSEATIILFKKNADGSLIMPPVYEKAPVYLFRTADGKSAYKVEFTQYKNEEGQSGHVKFRFAKIAYTATPDAPAQTKEGYIDATQKKTWTYFSLKDNKVVGTGEESEAGDAEWAKRSDWDIAVNRYMIRTNSGAATTIGSKGGVYICEENVTFAGLNALPQGAEFKEDTAVTSEGMSGTTTVIKSEATVILFKTNADGSLIMPPVYLKAPIYVFRSADGKTMHKVEFTQYKDEEGKSGHVKFNHAELK